MKFLNKNLNKNYSFKMSIILKIKFLILIVINQLEIKLQENIYLVHIIKLINLTII